MSEYCCLSSDSVCYKSHDVHLHGKNAAALERMRIFTQCHVLQRRTPCAESSYHYPGAFQTSVHVCDNILMEKSFVIYKTPIGPLKLEASDEGICAVKWLFGKHSEPPAGAAAAPPAQSETNAEHNAKQEAAIATDGGRTECKGSKAERHLQDCQSWLDAYFAGTLLKTNPPKPQLVLPHTGT